MRFERPEYFSKKMPEYVEFTPQPPPGYEHMSLEEVREHFETLLRQAEDAIRDSRERPVKGMKKVLEAGVYDTPNTPAPMGQLNPRISGSDKKLIADALAKLDKFYTHHEDARFRFYDGERKIAFPAGTILMCELANVKVKAVDPDDPTLRWKQQLPGASQASPPDAD